METKTGATESANRNFVSPSIQESPLILFCVIHKIPFMTLGDRVAYKEIKGVTTEYEEPIYECPKCAFPGWME